MDYETDEILIVKPRSHCTDENPKFSDDWGAIVVVTCICALVALVFASTVYDFMLGSRKHAQFLFILTNQ